MCVVRVCQHTPSPLPFSHLQLRVSNFSGGYLILAEGLCNPDDEMTFELVVGVASEDEVSVGVAGGDVVSVPLPLSVADGLVLTVGSIPGKRASYTISQWCIHQCCLSRHCVQ